MISIGKEGPSWKLVFC